VQITVHGFYDWTPTLSEWQEMLDTVQVGANQDCDVTIDGVTKTMKEWQMNGLSVRREKIRNVPSIEELRKSGFKVSVRHFRRYEDVLGFDHGTVIQHSYMTKTEKKKHPYYSHLGHNSLRPIRSSRTISSHGGWTILDVTTLTGRDVSVKYNVPQGHQFDRKRAIRACLGKLIKELGHE
jgi:hypothetical protein